MNLTDIRDNFNLFMSSTMKDKRVITLRRANKELEDRVKELEARVEKLTRDLDTLATCSQRQAQRFEEYVMGRSKPNPRYSEYEARAHYEEMRRRMIEVKPFNWYDLEAMEPFRP